MFSKTILYITKYYTPTTSAAGIRAQRFVDALVRGGYRVIVLTFGDAGGFEEVEPNLLVYRIGAEALAVKTDRWPGRMMLPGPDPDKACCQALFAHGQVVLGRHGVDGVLVSAPPFSFMAVAQQLAERFDKCLILDFRDAWFSGMPWPYKNVLRRLSAKQWERRCLESAEKIIVATDTLREILIDTYGDAFRNRIDTVRHGYESSGEEEDACRATDRPFRIVYTGQLRGIDIDAATGWTRVFQGLGRGLLRYTVGARFCEALKIEWMSPLNLFKAMAQAGRSDSRFLQRVRLDFVGEKFPEIDRWANELGLADVVHQLGPQSPQEAEGIARQADVLLLNLYGIKDRAYHWCVPSKIYTYMGTGKPIFALLPPGEAADLVIRAGTGLVVHPEDIDGMARYLGALVLGHGDLRASLKPKWEAIEVFRLAVQQEKFVRAVGEVVSDK